jgi:hypothetical protein
MKTLLNRAGVLALCIAAGQSVTLSCEAAVIATGTGVSLADYNGDWAKAMAAAKNKDNLITVPAGTWPSPQIRPYAGLTIRGAGANVSFITRNAPGTYRDGGVFKVTVPNVTITDLTVRGWPRAKGLSDDILVNGINATNLKVQRVNLEDAQGIGIQTEGQFMTGCLVEDVRITNTMLRQNGAHGVALWPYKGTSWCSFRRLYINGAAATGIAIDAGTTGDTNARSVNNNAFDDITIINGQREAIGYQLGAVMITGGQNNTFKNVMISDLLIGPAFSIGIDQSGIGSYGNIFTNVTLARISSKDLTWLDARACNNTFDGVSGGAFIAIDPGHCNIFRNLGQVVVR